jgi:hypothetical protein
MVSRDLVPMARECAGPRKKGKPLQLAVDSVPGTTAATQHPPALTSGAPFGGGGDQARNNVG